MGTYCYTAIPKKGHRRRGVIEAPSCQEAKNQLREQGIMVTRLWNQSARAHHGTLKGQNRVTFTAQLAQLIASGMPIFESLIALQEQCANERYHATILAICNQIKAGASLSAALVEHPASFDSLYCAMVAAGEASGTLPMVLQRLADLLTRQLKLKKQLISALTYPATIAAFCIAVIYLLLTFAIPSMAALLDERSLNSFTASVLAVSAFLTNAWFIYLPTLGAIVISSVVLLKSPRGKLWWKRRILKLPIIGSLVVRSALARFARTLATLQEGGLTLIESLQLARSVMLNPTLEEGMQRAEGHIIEGSSLSAELGKLSYVPRLFVRMVAVGEESGSLTPMLGQVADIYEGELQRALSRLTTLLQPIVLLVMGGIVGLIMLAVLLPLTDVSAIF